LYKAIDLWLTDTQNKLLDLTTFHFTEIKPN